MLSFFHIAYKFHKGGGKGHGQDGTEDTGELGSDDEGQNDDDGRYADDFADDQRINEIALELINDDIEADDQKHASPAARGESCDDGWYR